ncbi:Thioesterase/thiol ester dehydrase-isomerase [Westerdykella ornata]|uniref:Thioesterase/thiol ester dehydrase-isomerase n=1 Tax=Westerdykella ornata TaxID=318751 RepID=A0A6A6JW74_WESOR|nr:Thioesterase/thiol ester dehydrase-isomerase [Westerdykella ornata]KAF2280657.1 Thioesterase/thiol ester dehydrase-isomerase [Westerdykella ornata]
MALEALKSRRRSDYKFALEYRTRWSDNDMYSHVNNSVYYYLFDSVVNTYLIERCSLHPPTSSQIGLVVHSHCDYFAPVEFPSVVDVTLRVNKLGKSSVTYEIGVFERGQDEVKAVGEFAHVFVDRGSRKPVKHGMAEALRTGLSKILVQKPKL